MSRPKRERESQKKEPMKTFAARTFNFTHTFLKVNLAQQTFMQHPVDAKNYCVRSTNAAPQKITTDNKMQSRAKL